MKKLHFYSICIVVIAIMGIPVLQGYSQTIALTDETEMVSALSRKDPQITALFSSFFEQNKEEHGEILRSADSSDHIYANQSSRIAQVELNQKIKTPGIFSEGDLLEITLFEETHTITLDKITISRETESLRGRIEKSDFGFFILSIHEGQILGMIELPEKQVQYVIKYELPLQSYFLYQIPFEKLDILPSSPPLLIPEGNDMGERSFPVIKGDPMEEVNIDVMVVYTPAASNWASNNAGGIQNVIDQAMARANLVMDNSDTFAPMTLVYSSEVDYVESGSSSTDLRRLTFTTGEYAGYMDEVHTWRDDYGADLVALFAFVEDTGGVGWLLNNPSGRPNYGFSLTRVQQAAHWWTHIHEMGHNMGCHHHKGQNFQPGPGLFAYSAGWRWTGTDSNRYCTIMTYWSGSYFADGLDHFTVGLFSNPDLLYQGVAAGHSADGDNARTIREVKHAIASYRESGTAISDWYFY